MSKGKKSSKQMAAWFMAFFSALFLLLAGRFLYIQWTGVVQGQSLQQWADEKRTNNYTLPAERGKIIDRNGMVLAYDIPTYNIYAIVDESYSERLQEPKHVVDARKTADALAPLLNMDPNEIYQILSKEGQFQVELGTNGRYLSQKKKEEIEALDLPGIQFNQVPRRFYPNGLFASQVIGFALSKEGVIKGSMGIEKEMDDYLRGTPGEISYKRDKYNIKLLQPDEIMTSPKDGATVQLTLDQKIQTFLEDAMSQVEEQYQPEKIIAVVMNPKTGEILAMSNRPSFDLNDRSNITNWYNDVVSTPYEPGSTMKIFTLAAAIEEGVFHGGDTYQSGQYKIMEESKPIRDHNGGKGWGQITFLEGVQRSSNVAFAKLVWEILGTEVFREYLDKFHFGQPTGIDLPGEQAGEILFNYPIEKVTTAFGQGSTVTPIQQMMASSAVATDGTMVKPYVIKKIMDSENGETIKEGKTEQVGSPISAETAKEVREILGTVVTGEHGTGKRYQLDGYSVAGKTGTAEIPNPDGPGYLYGHGEYIFSFLGMAPLENPELVMYVSVKQPKLEKTESGAEPVSFIFRTVMENSLNYLEVKPDTVDVPDITSVSVDPFVGKSIEDAKKELVSKGVQPIILGNGNTIKRIHPDQNTVLPGEDVFLLTSDDEITIPDLTGWSLRKVMMLADLLKLDIEIAGNGYVTSQSRPFGDTIRPKQYLLVELSEPENGQSERTGEGSVIEQEQLEDENQENQLQIE
ncbi:penicillin-binding protein [Bacillaceae bacterium S4-13-58]